MFLSLCYLCFSLLMFSGLDGENYTLYARDNQVWSLRSYIFCMHTEVGMKIRNCRKAHYMMIIYRETSRSRQLDNY